MASLPTHTAMSIAERAGIRSVLIDEIFVLNNAIADYQKMASIGDKPGADFLLSVYLKEGETLSDLHRIALNKIFVLTREEMMGEIVGTLDEIISTNSADAIAASIMLKEIVEGKQISGKGMSQLIQVV